MGSVNSRRPDKMTCVRPRSWHCNCVCVSLCVCIWWCVSVVCTAPTLLFTVGDFRRIVGSWQTLQFFLLFFFCFLNLLVVVRSSSLSVPDSLAALMYMRI